MDNLYKIEVIFKDDDIDTIENTSIVDQIKTLPTIKNTSKAQDDSPIYTHNISKKPKEKKQKKKKKSKIDDILEFDLSDDYNEFDGLLDDEQIVDSIINPGSPKNIIKEQKKGYEKLKNEKNNFKKEFAEELTLLYNLLDETNKFGKDLEKELGNLRGSRVRGVSKYSNDLAELVLSSKQNKLNILKEITSVKKTIADLQIKSEGKNKEKAADNKSPEYMASAYFRNILSHGRNDFIKHLGGGDEDEYTNIVSEIERDKTFNTEEDYDYTDILEARLNEEGNAMRSDAGSKYIEYENRNVKVVVKKCIDTGEWALAAIDKHNVEIDDYPLPTRRELGKMKFSSDGNYATDEYGRMYTVMEYYLDEDDEDDDD